MPSREGAIHVAVTRRHYGGKIYENYLLRRSYREEGKVKKETLGNITHLPMPIIELIRGALRGEKYVPASDAFEVLRSHPHGHVAAVLGTLRKIGLDRMIASKPSRERDLVIAMIVSRVISPSSKLATARSLRSETSLNSLSHVLRLDATAEVSENELYGALDWLADRQQHIEKKLAEKHLAQQSGAGTPVLCDVSSSYYTGKRCALAFFGHNRDGKRGFPQIVYSLICNKDGCPVAIEVFKGNTADVKTLAPQIEKLRGRYGLDRLIVVGDRGMVTGEGIEEVLRPAGLDWITALRAPAIRKLARAEVMQLSLFDEQDLAEVVSADYPGERLIVCRNPLLAQERARTREVLLQETEKHLEKVVKAVCRAQSPLQGKEKIGLRVGGILNRFKVGKHFMLDINEEHFSYQRNQEKIEEEAKLDGIYVLRTSVEKNHLSPEAVVKAYKDLSHVEEAFRSLKTVDLEIRPIRHRLDERVRAHTFLCMLAYYVIWHMRRALAPLLFSEDDPEGARQARVSIVAPAKRSEKAKRKAASKRTEDGLPVHSFNTLLRDLSTICLDTARAKGTGAEFQVVTNATPTQRRALELLGVTTAV